jgi:hypothetical protein
MPFVDRAPNLPPPVPVDSSGDAPGPPGLLLQPGGPRILPLASPAGAPVPAAPVIPPSLIPAHAAADRALELDAERLLRLLSLRRGRPPRWGAPAFAREVDLVRAHLRPIRERALLASSFGREAFHGQAAPGSDVALGGSAVRVAYALRWLELGEGLARDDWRSLIR